MQQITALATGALQRNCYPSLIGDCQCEKAIPFHSYKWLFEREQEEGTYSLSVIDLIWGQMKFQMSPKIIRGSSIAYFSLMLVITHKTIRTIIFGGSLVLMFPVGKQEPERGNQNVYPKYNEIPCCVNEGGWLTAQSYGLLMTPD